MLARGLDTVKVTKVKGHAIDADVELGLAKLEDNLGNSEADAAADLGRRHQPEEVMDVRRALLDALGALVSHCPSVRLMVAIARVSVNHDGKSGFAPFLVWNQGGRLKQRKVDVTIIVTLLCFLALQVSFMGPGFSSLEFLSSLHWLADAGDMGHLGAL